MDESNNIYESQELLDQYLLFHYGTAEEVLPYPGGPHEALGFAGRTVTENLDTGQVRGRALDVGCAVGRSSFELSRFCESVTGIDFSSAFVDAATKLRDGETLGYSRLDEGTQSTPLTVHIPEGSHPERICFEVGDATALREDLGEFDVVHAANLICRLPDPSKFLQRLPSLVAPGGQLVLTTPCTWLGEFTLPEFWPQGPTLDWLDSQLGESFRRTAARDMPFLIREHSRKFQWSVAQASVWSRYS